MQRAIFITLLFALTTAGCGSGGTTCEPDATGSASACPNYGNAGIGVKNETCGGTSDCACGLFCNNGLCSPYQGEHACCWCTSPGGGAMSDTVSNMPDTTQEPNRWHDTTSHQPDTTWSGPEPDASWSEPSDATWWEPEPDPDVSWSEPEPDVTWTDPGDATWSQPDTEPDS